MRPKVSGWLFAAALLSAVPARADVRITMSGGTVSVVATDATLRQILMEWARVGQTRIINIERVSGGPVTLELANIPEEQALDTILRSVSGYLAAPRAEPLSGASRFDRIYLLPTSSGTPPRPAAPAPSPAPAFTPPAFPPSGDQDDTIARPTPVPAPGVPSNPPPRGPAFNTFPPSPAAPQPAPLPAGPVSYPAPTAPAGVSTPGMVVPTPQPPGQAQPGRPDQR